MADCHGEDKSLWLSGTWEGRALSWPLCSGTGLGPIEQSHGAAAVVPLAALCPPSSILPQGAGQSHSRRRHRSRPRSADSSPEPRVLAEQQPLLHTQHAASHLPVASLLTQASFQHLPSKTEYVHTKRGKWN